MGAVRFLSPPRERNPRQHFCAGAKAMSENAIAKMTMRQAEEEMACFRKIYSIVRLLDLKTIEENPCYPPPGGRLTPAPSASGGRRCSAKGRNPSWSMLAPRSTRPRPAMWKWTAALMLWR